MGLPDRIFGQKLDNAMFYNTFLKMACDMQLLDQSRNNNNRPNKKNDVITDLGGEGNFPMFLFWQSLFSDFPLVSLAGTPASAQRCCSEYLVSRWISIP